jgi:glycerol-3-phosphate acyltransferase PlsY
VWLGPALAIGGYLLGSISFAVIVARRKGIDLYAEGSGNPGATNVGRVIGKSEGRVVLALDALKGALPYAAARWALGPDDPWAIATGIATVVGHCAPVWHRFRGGKGAATAAGVMLLADPRVGAIAVATYLVLKRATKRASVGSLGGALAGAAAAGVIHGLATPITVMSIAIAVVVWVRHANNLVRLARGEEPPS